MIAEPLYNEKELLVLIQKGNEAAFTRFFHHHRDRVYSVAVKIAGSSLLAEEIVQDVFLVIWLKRSDLDKIENLTAYLYTVVQNAVYKSLKRIARQQKNLLHSVGDSILSDTGPETWLIEKEYRTVLQKGIDELPNQQREVYKLIREKGLKRKEVADLLHLQPDTVKFHLSKAVKSLWTYCQLHLHTFIAFALTALL